MRSSIRDKNVTNIKNTTPPTHPPAKKNLTIHRNILASTNFKIYICFCLDGLYSTPRESGNRYAQGNNESCRQ